MGEDIRLENDAFIVEVKQKGAEPARIYAKKIGKELLWNGDPKYWGRHAPVLFPIVGKVLNNEYKYNRENFQLGQHGFARDMEFELTDRDAENCTLILNNNAESKSKYPFDFKLEITISIKLEEVSVIYVVSNPGHENLFYSIGAHPAFNCPLNATETLEDYRLKFESVETVEQMVLSSSGQLTAERNSFLNQERQFALNEELFSKDALIFDDLKSQKISFCGKDKAFDFHVYWKNFPHLGIWKPAEAPFVCIEPWQGMADFENHNGQLKDKYGIVELMPGKSQEYEWGVRV